MVGTFRKSFDAVPPSPFVKRRPAGASTRLERLTVAASRVQELKSEQGQTLVEFALILPILLLLVIGIFDFGQAFNTKNDLTFLANTAARYAEVNQCVSCAPGQTINDYVKGTAVGVDKPFITVRWPDGTHAAGDRMVVTASGCVNWLAVSLPGLRNGGSTRLETTVTVRILTDPGSTPLYSTSSTAPPC
jgi:hypothetical protein